ncbi:hypothetical protein [Caballeronia sp. LZ034LL]|uniref:hypothetical protein n=1 Tax=Caballeronia sp. LZ034LL TaxID=3038567 RepID=UPI00285C6B9A|nr:hypothetical protein [Caballeronia sp. LZ034LL]MDR5833214.1 hypothetical protein [Caballeronia sp. LZ034LL]
MSNTSKESFYSRLIEPMIKELERLARITRGEQSVEDLKAEAWIAATEINEASGRAFEPEDRTFQQAIIDRLKKAFGRFANRAMRFAARLDHEETNGEGEVRNGLAATLTAPQAYEPETSLIEAEEAHRRERAVRERYTEAVAYLRVLDRFDDDKLAIARYLAIRRSTLELRLRKAEETARQQASMFDRVTRIPDDFCPPQGLYMRPSPTRLRRQIAPRCAFLGSWQRGLFSAARSIWSFR